MAVTHYNATVTLALKYAPDLSKKTLGAGTTPTADEMIDLWDETSSQIDLEFAKAGFEAPLTLAAASQALALVQRVEAMLTSAKAIRTLRAFGTGAVSDDVKDLEKEGMKLLADLVSEPTYLAANGLTSGTPEVPNPIRASVTNDRDGIAASSTTFTQIDPIAEQYSTSGKNQL